MDTPLSTDATPAAPSAAPLDPTTALAEASPEAYVTWQKTGALPRVESPESPDPPSPVADSTPAAPDSQASDVLAAPSADKKDPGTPRKDARAEENRVPVLLADRARERARAEAAEARAAQLERELAALRPPAPPDAKTAGPSPAAATDPRDPEPDPENAERYPDGLYDRKYYRDLADWSARNVLRAEREQMATATKQRQADERERERNRSWKERVDAARAKDPDYDAKAFSGPTSWQQGSPIDVWILDSPQGADLLPYLMTHPEEARRIDALPAVLQLRELARLEQSLEPAPAKTITDAPAPPRTLGDRTTAAADAVTRAISNKDPGAYIDEMNRRELAARRV